MAFYTFTTRRDEATGQDEDVLYIDGILEVDRDWWLGGAQVIARDFRRSLGKLQDVTVYINSPGGDVMAGAEIYTALREHSEQGKGRVTVKVTGIAASAASVVAMAGDEVLMSPVAYMMIHNPWSAAVGNAKELRKQADALDVISEGLVSAYERRTGKTRDELMQLLDGETYMSAQTCVDEGFADGILYGEASAGDDGQRKTTAMMQAKNYGRQAVMAMLRLESLRDSNFSAEPKNADGRIKDSSAAPLEHEPEPAPDPQPDPDAAKRAEFAKRAAFMAKLF